MLYPLTFHPRFKERVWGGRELAALYGKALPADVPIGESWEISDRLGDVSVIANGPLAGKDLSWLMTHHAAEMFGEAGAPGGRFPLLIKLLDARERLSLQVHPPPEQAAALGGEPKTEMWYVAAANPAAELYVGLRHGVTRADFESKIRDGTVADCFHRVPVQPGDVMFLPSGRVHAIGAGLVIFEIQQNSDTTYRVFDWNRVGLDGQPRALHIAPSLASIDFNDFEPGLVNLPFVEDANLRHRRLVEHPLFVVDEMVATSVTPIVWRPSRLQIIGLVTGQATVTSPGADRVELRAGQFCLMPAALPAVTLAASPGTVLLRIEAGRGQQLSTFKR